MRALDNANKRKSPGRDGTYIRTFVEMMNVEV